MAGAETAPVATLFLVADPDAVTGPTLIVASAIKTEITFPFAFAAGVVAAPLALIVCAVWPWACVNGTCASPVADRGVASAATPAACAPDVVIAPAAFIVCAA